MRSTFQGFKFMQKRKLGAVLLTAIICASCTDKPLDRITAEGILADVEVLSADNMEGRAAGTPGIARAEAYIANRFEKIGLESFGDSSYSAARRTGRHDEECRKIFRQYRLLARALTLEEGVQLRRSGQRPKRRLSISWTHPLFSLGLRRPGA